MNASVLLAGPGAHSEMLYLSLQFASTLAVLPNLIVVRTLQPTCGRQRAMRPGLHQVMAACTTELCLDAA